MTPIFSSLEQWVKRPRRAFKQLKVGSYRIGGTPTVHDGAPNPIGTQAHEQHHRDSMTNTYYGYVVSRGTELSVLPGIAPETVAVIDACLSSAWDTLEGSAVAIEYLALFHGDRPPSLRQFKRRLPPAYAKAFAPYEKIIQPHVKRQAGMMWIVMTMALVSAASEIILDIGFYYRAKDKLDYRYWLKIASAPVHEETTRLVVRGARELNQDHLARHWQDEALAGNPAASSYRSFVETLKMALIEICFRDRLPEPTLATHRRRYELIKEVDAQLVGLAPGLPTKRFDADHVAGAEMAHRITAQSRIMPHEVLSLSELEQRLPAYHAEKGVAWIVFAAALADGGKFRLLATPISREHSTMPDGGIAYGYSADHFYLVEGLSSEDLLAFAAKTRAGEEVWLTTTIPMPFRDEIDPLIGIQPPVQQLDRPTFVYCSVFRSDWLRSVIRRLDSEPQLEMTKYPFIKDRSVLRAAFGNLSLFWILSGLVPYPSGEMMIDEFVFHPIEEPWDEALCVAVILTQLGAGAVDEEA